MEFRPELAECVSDPSKPLNDRFHALFALRNIGGQKSIDAIAKCFTDTSALFKHECAYCLGQMQDPAAIPILKEVLSNKNQEPMTRHEAGEALGAIGDQTSREILKEFVNDPLKEVSETCQLALDRLDWLETNENVSKSETYNSVDPAPPTKEDMSTPELRNILLDSSLPLFKRYRALFALRNRGGEECVKAIVDGFADDSALFRHELGYVLGQMQHPAAVEGLVDRLNDENENEMVRHECAEALGSIATDECAAILKKGLSDKARVVKESCVVALDIHEQETQHSVAQR